jgi:hypothetical protein
LRSVDVSSAIFMARGEICPPGVTLEDCLPIVCIPDVDDLEDSLDPGWKGLKSSNSLLVEK